VNEVTELSVISVMREIVWSESEGKSRFEKALLRGGSACLVGVVVD
jgi:hypothetical protein